MPVLSVLQKVGLSLVKAMLTQEVIEWLVWWGLEKLVASTDDRWDDELLEGIRSRVKGKEEEK